MAELCQQAVDACQGRPSNSVRGEVFRIAVRRLALRGLSVRRGFALALAPRPTVAPHPPVPRGGAAPSAPQEIGLMPAPAVALTFIGRTGIARFAPLASVTELAPLTRWTAVAIAEIPLAWPAELPRLVAVVVAFSWRPPEFARRLALRIAALHVPRRALCLEVDDIGLRPMAGRDHLVLFGSLCLFLVQILAAEGAPDAAGRTVLLGKALRGSHDPQIMLGMLVIVLGHDRVA